MLLQVNLTQNFDLHCSNRVRTGYGKPGKSWNISISFSRPGKSWKIKVLFDRLVAGDDKARTM